MINTTDGFAAEELFSWEHAYIDAYYYAITTLTTVGYGDRTPNTDGEKIYSILTELAGERHRHTHTGPAPGRPTDGLLKWVPGGHGLIHVCDGRVGGVRRDRVWSAGLVTGWDDDRGSGLAGECATEEMTRQVDQTAVASSL